MADFKDGHARGERQMILQCPHMGESLDVIDVTDPQRKTELRDALGRALNCWEKKPEWLQELYDELSK